MRENYKRVQLDMSEETFIFLDELKRKTHSASKAEVVKNAIVIYDYIVDQVRKKNDIIVRNGSGPESTLVLPIMVPSE